VAVVAVLPELDDGGGEPAEAVVGVTDYQANGSPLRRLLEETAAEHGIPMKDLTVLATQNDPFRVDTPAGHRDGAWLANTARELGLGERRIHLRGLHYMVLGRPKPDGEAYANTDADWLWLQGNAGKAARWLGYLPFDQIVDQRNDAPTVRRFTRSTPYGYISVGVDVDIPDPEDLMPAAAIMDFTGAQPYKLVMVGEKASLGEVLGPVAERREADLYLTSGEISDTLIYQMARVAAEDGRPMVVLYFADADPAGWQMGISVARKLQAFKALAFPGLEFEVHRVALTPAQVREYGLPYAPLKETERRGDAWRAAMGIEQTEIDALAALQPELLARLARDATRPYFDSTLGRRVAEARRDWLARAQAAVDEQLDADRLGRIRREADAKLAAMRVEIDALNDALRVGADDFDLPEPVVPAPELDGQVHPLPLLDSGRPFAEQCRRLIDSKAYRNGGDS
jgi:hypothetical protein